MSYCRNINSDGRFMNEVFKSFKEGKREAGNAAPTFALFDRKKPFADLLFDVIDRYEKLSVDLSNTFGAYKEAAMAVERFHHDDFWAVYTKTDVMKARCTQCSTQHSVNYSYDVADFNSERYAKCREVQENARRAKLGLPAMFFVRDLARACCSQVIPSFLENIVLNGSSTAPVASVCEARDPAITSGNMQIRALFENLLARRNATLPWLEKTDQLRGYNADVTSWLLYAGSMLMRCASYSDHAFILGKLLTTDSPSAWRGPELIQFPQNPRDWTVGLADHYLQMLHFAVGFGFIPPEMFADELILRSFSSVTEFETYNENNGGSANLAIPDRELAEILHQFGPLAFLDYVLGESVAVVQGGRGPNGAPPNIAYMRSVFLRLLMFIRIVCKASMVLTLSDSVQVLLKYASVVVNKIADAYDKDKGRALDAICSREIIENAVLNVAYAIVHTVAPDMWSFLGLLPVYVLGERSAWEMFSILHMLPAAGLRHSKEEWTALVAPVNSNNNNNNGNGSKMDGNDDEWVIVDEGDDEDEEDGEGGEGGGEEEKKKKKKKGKKDKDTKERKMDSYTALTSKIIEVGKSVDNIRNAATAIWSLAEINGGRLTYECMGSLFRIVFSSGMTEEKVSGTVMNLIGALCSSSPANIKLVLDIFPAGFDAGEVEPPLFLQLVDKIPFGDWNPDPEDARTVASWTRGTMGSPRHETGKYIVDTVQWPKVSIEANRAAACVLFRAMGHQRSVYKSLSIIKRKSKDFKKYCSWAENALGSLLYYAVGKTIAPPQSGGRVAEDTRTVVQASEALLNELREADKKGSVPSLLKKKDPEELFALLMLAPFGVDPAVWTHEGAFVMKLVKALVDDPDVDEFKTPVLCQLVPYVFANVEDKEALKARIIPDYSDVVFKYMKNKASNASAQKGRSEGFDGICHQLISRQIDTYPPEIASSFCDFWLKIATFQKKWLSDVPSLVILSVLLQSWFALKNGDLPLPAYETTILTQIVSSVNAKNISMIPLKAHGLRSESVLNQFPYVLFETLFYETKYLLEENLLHGEVLAKKAKQWSRYATRLPDTCEIGILFWQMTTCLCLMAIKDKKCSSSALKPLVREKVRAKIVGKLEAVKSASKSKDLVDFYAALREYYWSSMQPGKGEDQSPNWMLAAMLRSSPLESPSSLLLSQVPRDEIARTIRSSLAHKEATVSKITTKYIRLRFNDVLGRCRLRAPKPLPNFSPNTHEATWDDNVDRRKAVVTSRILGVDNIYKDTRQVDSIEISVDRSICETNANYENLCHNLYRSVTQTSGLRAKCSCGCFLNYTFDYSTAVKDENIENMLISNRKEVMRLYNSINKVSEDTSNRIVFLDDTVHKITLLYESIVNQADAVGEDKDIVIPQNLSNYVWKLYDEVVTGIDLRNVNAFFLNNMLKHSLYEMTNSIVRTNYDGSVSVLERLLRGPPVGMKIAPYYTPWIMRRGFVDLLHKMLNVYIKGNSLHEYVLKNFNIYEWARLGRPLEEKIAAILEVSTMFSRCLRDDFLCEYAVTSFEGALRESFPALLLPALDLFVPRTDCPSHRLWGVLSVQNLSIVPPDQARSALGYISTNLVKFRGRRDFHFKGWGPAFPEFVNLLTANQVRIAGMSGDFDLSKSFFAEALKVYAPCLDAVGPNSPWEAGSLAETTELVSMFTKSFVALAHGSIDFASNLCEHFVAETWRYVTETLRTLGPGNLSRGVPKPFIQDAMLSSLSSLPWGEWLPPRNVFNDIIAMACENIETHAIAPSFSRFMVSFGTAITWRETNYYSADTLLQLHCALTRSLALYPEPVERTVYDQVYRLNTGTNDKVGWDLLGTDMLKAVMDESVQLLVKAPRHKDELFKWFVIYVYIAQTCGVKIANPDTDPETDFCKGDEYYANVLTSENFAAFVDYFIALQQLDPSVCPGLPVGPVDAILCAFKGFFDGSAGTVESVGAAVSRFFYLYNNDSKGTYIHPEVVTFLKRYPECACALSQYLCYCVADLPRLLPNLEDYLGCYFTKFGDWGAVSRHISISPTTTPQSFIEKAVANSYYLSFFAAFKLISNYGMDVLNLDLYGLIEKATVTPGKEQEFFLFCYALIRQTCIKLSTQPTTQMMFCERIQLEKIEDFLKKIALGKTHEGFLGKIGLGKRSELDTVFRVCAKTIAAFIRAQYIEGDKKKIGTIRILERDPFSLKENLALYKDVSFKKYIKRLGDSYIARVSEYFYDIMSNPEFTIFSYSRLLASIAECVYQGKALELSCFRDDIEVEIDVKAATRAIVEEMRNPGNLDGSIVLRNGSAHLGSLGSLGFNQRTVFELEGTDLIISLICSPDYQKSKEDIQVALTALWELVLVDIDIQAYAISRNVIPEILKIIKSTPVAAEAAYRLLSALLADDEIYRANITDDIIAKAAKTKSTKVFAAALARTEDEEVAELRGKGACSGSRALRCTEKKCLDKKVFFCPHCNVQQHFYVCITCSKEQAHTVQFCEVCWSTCHPYGVGHVFKRIFGVGKCSCKNYKCKAAAVTSSVEFSHMDPPLVAQWARSACQFDEATAEIFRQKNVSGKALLSMSKSDMGSIGFSLDQITTLRTALGPYKSFSNRAASLFSHDYSYVDTLFGGECKFSFPSLYSHPKTLNEALAAAQDILPPAIQIGAIHMHCVNLLMALKNDPERMAFVNQFSLTDDEIMAVLMYTYDISVEDAESAAAAASNGACFAVQFNRLLRQYTPTMQNSLSGYMYFTIAALKKIPPYMGLYQGMYGEDVYVYRGVPDFSVFPNFEEVYAQGKEITWPSFSSVTASVEESRMLAWSGTDPSLRLLFIIRVKKSARDIHCISAFSSDSEVLIAPGTTFRVVSPMEWSDPESSNRIELEEVDTKFF